ncbi:MAG: site-specific DNA-methyltransferase [Acidobacteriota bacterium]|nr:site-specific DNA-methyltransferase [Acidobacteriota bacterium]
MPRYEERFKRYLKDRSYQPVFFSGNALTVLKHFPDESIHFCMTSPPYWTQREYHNGGVGLESKYAQYLQNLLPIISEIKRVLKPTGSLWLNLGDTYQNKGLVGLPWRVALAMIDEQKWTLRNDVIWNKIKGLDNRNDKLRNIHEYIFHFVKDPKCFYYNADVIRSKPRKAVVKNGTIISATGVTGVSYRRQIELSTSLSNKEKKAALQALHDTLEQIAQGKLSDFRMVIRNQHRATHSTSEKLSGRAVELLVKGFYILKYHPKGSKPGDVWDIIPEDTNREDHYAAYPQDLCRVPILATCPPKGIVLDPFCGTGTTNYVAQHLARKSIGIDLSYEYIKLARRRCR